MVNGSVVVIVRLLNHSLQQRGPVRMYHSNTHRKAHAYMYLLQHYVVSYYTGETYDCGQSNCKLSSSHMHRTATVCSCNTVCFHTSSCMSLYADN
jgi:hypothetical protein